MFDGSFERRKVDRDRHIIAAHTHRCLGPTLIVVGGLHGNEPGGVEAMRRVKPQLDALKSKLRGRVYFVAGNTRALAKRVRYRDLDLNRAWTREDMANVGTAELCRKSEGLELTELDQLFDGILVTARNGPAAADRGDVADAALSNGEPVDHAERIKAPPLDKRESRRARCFDHGLCGHLLCRTLWL
jgi:predicted deacylase